MPLRPRCWALGKRAPRPLAGLCEKELRGYWLNTPQQPHTQHCYHTGSFLNDQLWWWYIYIYIYLFIYIYIFIHTHTHTLCKTLTLNHLKMYFPGYLDLNCVSRWPRGRSILSDKRQSELFLLPINQLESISHTSCHSVIIHCICFIWYKLYVRDA